MASMRSRTGRLVLIFGSCTDRKRGFRQYAPRLLLFGSRKVGGPSHFSVAPCGMFAHSSVGKESACSAGDSSSIPGLGRSAGEGTGYPLQYSWACLVAQLVKNPPTIWETGVPKIPWRRERLPTPVFWPGEFHGLNSQGVAKS